MGTNHLMRRRAVRFAVESSAYGTYAAPSVAVPILGDVSVRPWVGNHVQRNTVRPYLGTVRSIPVGEYATIDFSVELAGSGAAATAPAYAGLLKAVNLASETILASPITGTAQSGSTGTTIKLASGASSTDDLYAGMTVTTTGGTGSGQAREITAYDGTTKVATVSAAWAVTPDATTAYSIGANVGYLPVSVMGASTSVTLEIHTGAETSSASVRHQFVGCRGSATLEFSKDQLPSIKFSLMGLVYGHADSTLPALDFSAWQAAIPVTTTNSGTGLMIAGFSGVVLDSLTLDIGAKAAYRGVVNDTSIRITDRAVTGRANVAAWALSEADFWTRLRQAQESPLLIRHGTAAGNSVTVLAPAVQITDGTYTDVDGIAHLDLSFAANAFRSSGNDELKVVTK